MHLLQLLSPIYGAQGRQQQWLDQTPLILAAYSFYNIAAPACTKAPKLPDVTLM